MKREFPSAWFMGHCALQNNSDVFFALKIQNINITIALKA